MRIINKTRKHWLLIFLILVRLPYLYLAYPGFMLFDSASSIAQFYGIHTNAATLSATPEYVLTDHHLVFFTLLMGGFVKLGELLGNQNDGLFFYIIIQVIISNGIIVYFLKAIKEQVPRLVYILTILFFAFAPHVSIWQITVSKDSYFAPLLLLLCCLTYVILKSDREFLKSKKNLGVSITVACLCCLTKHQGAYILLFLGCVITIFYRKRLIRAGVIFLSAGIFFLAIFPNLLLMFGISKTGKQEAFGFMFQQTARYVLDYSNEVTQEEKESIDAILPYDELKTLYSPSIQDTVKFKYKQQTTNGELLNYIKIWLKMFFKHPDAYINATFDTCKGYFVDYNKSMKYVPRYIQALSIVIDNPILDIKNTQPYNTVRKPLHDKMLELGSLPVVHILFNYPFYTWTTLVALLILLIKKRWKIVISFLPVLLSIMILIICPDVEFRYFLPIIYAWPFIMCFVFSSIYSGRKKKECIAIDKKDKIDG